MTSEALGGITACSLMLGERQVFLFHKRKMYMRVVFLEGTSPVLASILKPGEGKANYRSHSRFLLLEKKKKSMKISVANVHCS